MDPEAIRALLSLTSYRMPVCLVFGNLQTRAVVDEAAQGGVRALMHRVHNVLYQECAHIIHG